MTSAERSNVMRAVKGQNTKPELAIRKMAHGLGYRYRLHRKDLPGKPDIVFTARRKIIFVHGCFWHGHICKRGRRLPKSNTDYWIPKLRRNVERDKQNIQALTSDGWDVLIIWECETKELAKVERRIVKFLEVK